MNWKAWIPFRSVSTAAPLIGEKTFETSEQRHETLYWEVFYRLAKVLLLCRFSPLSKLRRSRPQHNVLGMYSNAQM